MFLKHGWLLTLNKTNSTKNAKDALSESLCTSLRVSSHWIILNEIIGSVAISVFRDLILEQHLQPVWLINQLLTCQPHMYTGRRLGHHYVSWCLSTKHCWTVGRHRAEYVSLVTMILNHVWSSDYVFYKSGLNAEITSAAKIGMQHKIVNMLGPKSHHNPQPNRSSSSGTPSMIKP